MSKIKITLNLLCFAIFIGFVIGIIIALFIILDNQYFEYKMIRLIMVTMQNCLMKSISISAVVILGSYYFWNFFQNQKKYNKSTIIRIIAIVVLIFTVYFFLSQLLLKFRPYTLASILSNIVNLLKNLSSGEITSEYFFGLFKKHLIVAVNLFLVFVIFIMLSYLLIARRRFGVLIGKMIAVRLPKRISFVMLVFLATLNIYIFIDSKSLPSRRPNIILIYLDALRPDHLGCYGYARNTSPHIDSLANKGVLFVNAFSQAPGTFPSVHSCLTSKYAFNFFTAKSGKSVLNNRYLTLAEVLKNYGYYTVGISSNPVISKSETFYSLGGFGQGFDFFDDSVCYGKKWNWRWRSPEGVIEKALMWLEKLSRKKFFLFLYIMDPHCDYNPPEPYNKLYDPNYSGKEQISKGLTLSYARKIHRGIDPNLDDADIYHLEALYDGEIKYADTQIGRLIQCLGRLKLLDNTLVVLMSDHGEEFFEHQGLKHGTTLYNELIKIPLIFYYPKSLPKGVRVDNELVQSIDVVPTILDIVKIAKPHAMQGESMLCLLDGKNINWREYAFSEAPLIDAKAITTKSWKYIHYFNTDLIMTELCDKYTNENRLYDLENDPHEISNLYTKETQVVEKLRNKMIELLSEAERKRLLKKVAVEFNEGIVEKFKSLGYLQ